MGTKRLRTTVHKSLDKLRPMVVRCWRRSSVRRNNGCGDRAAWTTPHPDRLAFDHPRQAEILAAHARAVEKGEAGYSDPDTGLFVLTAAFHVKRGRAAATDADTARTSSGD